MRRGGIGTRYAAYLVALTLLVAVTALVAAALIAFRQTRILQAEIHEAVVAARSLEDEETARKTAAFLSSHLFNPLYGLDVERLNEEIVEFSAWLPVTSFLVLDRHGRVLADGSAANPRYGEKLQGPLPSAEGLAPLAMPREGETELRFVVHSGEVTAGWGVVTLAEAPSQASLRRLEDGTAALWAAHRTSLLSLGVLALAAILALGFLTSTVISRTLARPLTQMAHAAKEIAAGRLERPLAEDRTDEVGDLARALNAMVRDLRAHEQERERLIGDLERKNTELERFTYTVSHDLKSPLVTILGFAGLAEADLEAGARERARRDLGRISAAAGTMQHLLDDLLELSRVGRVVNPPADVPFGELAREATEIVRGRLAEKGVRVKVAEGLPAVRVDRRRMLEVMQNLLENAAKFTGAQAEPRVEIGARSDNGERVFYVRDNGQGLEARFRERVFDLFAKLDPAAEGTGVGLALARRIVEAHGGRIWAESEGLGHGTTFCFTLPTS
jgi:signal transduction histidine kinase